MKRITAYITPDLERDHAALGKYIQSLLGDAPQALVIKGLPPNRVSAVAERNERLLADRRAGKTFKELELAYGITREQCRNICNKAGLPKAMKPRLPLEKRDAIGQRILNGDRVSIVARESGLSTDTVATYAQDLLSRLPGYDWEAYYSVLSTPGMGKAKAAMTYYREVASQPRR